MNERYFPIMRPHDRRGQPDERCPTTVPWTLLEPYADRAEHFHGRQSLGRLAQRGGLAPQEVLALIHNNTSLWYLPNGEAVARLIEWLTSKGVVQ